MIIGLILFSIPSAFIASYKGFKPLRWLIAFGLIGMLVVIFLSNAKEEGISPEESTARAAKANTVGVWMCGINLGLAAISVLLFLSNIN